MKKRLISLILASVGASALIAATPAASATLVANGGFQSGVNGGNPFETVNAVNSTKITDWTVASGSVDWIHGYWEGSSGSTADYSVDLSGNSQGFIQQLISGLVQGQLYSLTFDTALNPDHDDLPQSMAWTLGTSQGSTSVGSLDPNLGWTSNVFNFLWTEASTTALLVFSSTVPGGNINCCFGPALDNVALNAVPLPAALPLFAAGLGAMGYLGSRRRRKASSAA